MPSLDIEIAYYSFLIAIAVSVFFGWRLSLPRKSPDLPVWRRHLLRLGLIGNAGSLAGFLILIFQAVLTPRVSDDIRNYTVFLFLAVAPVVLGLFGKHAARILVILNGLALTYLWLEIGASSL
jgi:hypothetical protein